MDRGGGETNSLFTLGVQDLWAAYKWDRSSLRLSAFGASDRQYLVHKQEKNLSNGKTIGNMQQYSTATMVVLFLLDMRDAIKWSDECDRLEIKCCLFNPFMLGAYAAVIFIANWLTLPILRLLSSKPQWCQDFWKSFKPYHVGIY